MNPIKDPIKDALVPLRTNFNANGSVRWCTSVYLNLFHWPMGKNSGDRNGVCRYVRALPYANFISTIFQKIPKMFGFCVFRAIYFITAIFWPKIAQKTH
jgi:hypothetical protein